MDQRLVEYAASGDVAALNALLKVDPLILEKVALAPVADTPLHIAALAGKTDFVKELLKRTPSFALELNQDGLSPMHIAAAKGHIYVVKELLKLCMGMDQCLLKDRGARTPLHYAAIKGRVDIIGELLAHCPQAVEEVTARGETALHLAVKNNQFEALRVFVQWLNNNNHGHGKKLIINAEDKEGNTILNLAIATKQLQVVDLLRKQSELQHKEQIVEIDGGSGTHSIMLPQTDLGIQKAAEDTSKSKSKNIRIRKKSKYEKLIPVVASLIASVTFQAGVTPPQSVWKEGMKPDWDCLSKVVDIKNIRGFFDFTKACPTLTYISFMSFNTTGFSCAFVFLVLSFIVPGFTILPMIFSLVALFCAYITLLTIMSPDGLSFIIVFLITSFVLIFYLVIPVIFYIIFKILKPTVKTLWKLVKFICVRRKPPTR
uniref:Uncharacterized protein n=1 Tax=Davidia involucrata TaxID=16924 RepID=A0A5B7C048_DAVIN